MNRSLNFDSTCFSAIQSPVTLFQADIISSMSENDVNQSDKRSSDVGHPNDYDLIMIIIIITRDYNYKYTEFM